MQVMRVNDRATEVLHKLKEVSQRMKDDYCEIAELLHEVWENEYHKDYGYDSFHDYVEDQLDIKGRKANFLVQITKTLKRLQIPWEDVSEVGWRKMAAISPVLNSENNQKWIDEAKTTTLTYLSEKVKAEKENREPSENPPIKMTIQVDEDENTIIQTAIEFAKRHEGVKSNSKALVHICYAFATYSEGD